MRDQNVAAEIAILGGGLAGLSAAIYLGRAKRDTLVIDEGKSMARWEPDVQNYLGFPEGVAGTDLLQRARDQAQRYGVRFSKDRILWGRAHRRNFALRGRHAFYRCRRLLLATGIFHIPPDLRDVESCLGHSMFFCKDCDGFRVSGKRIGVYGWTNQAADYALGMLLYSPEVAVVTDGRRPGWDRQHQRWVQECRLQVFQQPISDVWRVGPQIQALKFEDGGELLIDALFTTRGDVCLNEIAIGLGAKLNDLGEVVVDADMRTNVQGVYAAGCVTPANCQMIIAAGQGAAAAQTINRDILEESLTSRRLRRFRSRQLRDRSVRRAASCAPV